MKELISFLNNLLRKFVTINHERFGFILEQLKHAYGLLVDVKHVPAKYILESFKILESIKHVCNVKIHENVTRNTLNFSLQAQLFKPNVLNCIHISNASGRPLVTSRDTCADCIKAHLMRWLLLHVDNPYPTPSEYYQLCLETGLTRNQLRNWFSNRRR
ncbi:P-specific transcription factor Pi at silenced MAT3 locus [Schizosaccharomyces osmophilus]|uniref:Mating-type P-specific polypeptide Pi n=1 Tax=Schizosaccharomyces osmophilus TaxID=2545709 RepID=A0AAE9W9V2_9SCHI|nr:mating-type P-specific polypeptide Pi [Schizosaccharomyces osmophilus]XP_056036572.1 P-specific transcription factor Pi at silenced MAT3 locus [Schizosaccharomyces osmophilus]WBW72170.1 mating-type P-specific polypeptide Pi [Schizosaccharomyces osmophilus]WBW72329.1 P-specific transcription factor Pi at silenced MAT3 locus [Schizosaccharomyces osmophilus]